LKTGAGFHQDRKAGPKGPGEGYGPFLLLLLLLLSLSIPPVEGSSGEDRSATAISPPDVTFVYFDAGKTSLKLKNGSVLKAFAGRLTPWLAAHP
jgi:hypothetical protein